MLKLMYITNKPQVALIAENAGVDRIFVDLETIGKDKRQKGMDTVQSRHTIDDIRILRNCLSKAELLVRVNPIHENSKQEIDASIEAGADVLMLPFFQTAAQATQFVDMVHGRAKTCLLIETPESAACVDEILALEGVDEYFIGLNDLHLGYGMKFMFQLLADGTVDRLCEKFAKTGKPFGFGGIARVGMGQLPAEMILGEHVRLSSKMAILSRSFCNSDQITDEKMLKKIFDEELPKIRAHETRWMTCTSEALDQNHTMVQEKVANIVEGLS